jgi:3-deoxy-manno-octulosonate cytidylyltransferase (CMP-KDO synthetase)
MSQKIIGIIPARFGSTRFPGKPLAMIHGKQMIRHVYEKAIKCPSIQCVTVATDDARIYDVVKKFGGDAVLTSNLHQSGTERCAEVIDKMSESFDAVINIQGDEPFINPDQIEMLCSFFIDESIQIATIVKRILDKESLFNPNVVKVTIAENGKALYFSRSVIPYQRDLPENGWMTNGLFYKHLGMYGYKKEILKKIVKLPVSYLEKAESLEQLRWLSNGYSIQTGETFEDSVSIDTLADLQKAEKEFKGNN